jgi:hypothetical protein
MLGWYAFDINGNRTNRDPFDFGERQAEQSHRSSGSPGEASWPSSKNFETACRHARRRGNNFCSRQEAQAHDRRTEEGLIAKDEGSLGEAPEASERLI